MKDNHVAVILEDINYKFDIFAEIASDVVHLRSDSSWLAEESAIIQQKIRDFRKILKDTNIEVKNHEVRITRLETGKRQRLAKQAK